MFNKTELLTAALYPALLAAFVGSDSVIRLMAEKLILKMGKIKTPNDRIV
jgi:hypothetical protein